MSKLVPINDVALIEVQRNPHKTAGLDLVSSQKKEGVETGKLIALPDEFPYFSSNSWSFESSFANTEGLKAVLEYYKPMVGHRVVWEAYAERGCEVEHEGKTYVLLKLTKILGCFYDEEVK